MTVAEPPVAAPPVPATGADGTIQHVLLEGVSWAFYEQAIRELDGQHFRITYDQGRMEIMAPSGRHERAKTLVGYFIESYASERDIDWLGLGSLTCRREDLARGLEPDECYYIKSRPRDPDEVDLSIDPPPDLAIEIDIASGSIARQPIYAALGVPEVWRFDGQRVTVLLRQPEGTYKPSAGSVVFPHLDMDQFNRFLAQGLASQRAAVVAFRKWVRGK